MPLLVPVNEVSARSILKGGASQTRWKSCASFSRDMYKVSRDAWLKSSDTILIM